MRARVRDNRLVDRWASLWGRQLVVRTRYRLTQRRVGELTSLLADVLQYNPLIGRSVSANTRELVIGRRARGYVALYRYIEQADTVFVLAIRSQREAGYGRD